MTGVTAYKRLTKAAPCYTGRYGHSLKVRYITILWRHLASTRPKASIIALKMASCTCGTFLALERVVSVLRVWWQHQPLQCVKLLTNQSWTGTGICRRGPRGLCQHPWPISNPDRGRGVTNETTNSAYHQIVTANTYFGATSYASTVWLQFVFSPWWTAIAVSLK